MALRSIAGAVSQAVTRTMGVKELGTVGAFRTLGQTNLNLFGTRFYGDAALSKDEVTARVLDVVKNMEKVDPAKVNAESCDFTKDLGLDSLDTVEVVMAFEEEFQLEIPDEEADKIASCQQAIEYITKHPMAK
ncbi:acyl carrier protein [Chloropicon primus]|uniref:Acyl carrier protein n=1 Tax=Chloropicon primus TaxID=1764295 RepID=A0A5B8MFX3_9CHLO|nr:acyl carrier protein [Chloropicon primus]UPQ97443.1 acyl carrier protein [Chloropicon primus]|mmetsp:Transcript_16953/g.34675  ORF Transcript_16953/g.34675 Transcript_16953/m.34675 type:complete len:133 (-) Transcript_16953:1070-1468(-)|eukprot:QDZ18232.1 acyl carrier protein [Chloropicon primus]